MRLVLMLIAAAASFAAGTPTVQLVAPGAPPIQAGGAPVKFTITIANDQAGDMPTVTSFTLGGVACTAATCGSFSAVTGTAGSGSYSTMYTPPASLAAAISPTVTVEPSLSGPAFASTLSFTVYPAGLVVAVTSITGAGGLSFVQIGTGVRTVTITAYNDSANAGVALTLTGSGYACQNLSQNSCGTLGTPTVSTSGTTTTTTVTYTPPVSVPDEPYDRVRIQATSAADPTKLASVNFLLSATPGPGPIPYGQKFDTALTGGTPIPLTADFLSDPTAANWTLTANGAVCAPACGTLGTPVVAASGTLFTSTVTYTPPASVPSASGQDSPTIMVSLAANGATPMDGFSFNIVDGSCGNGNNSALSGQYAFLLKGGSATAGYQTNVGSFTADGNGNITGGLQDSNRSSAVLTNLTLSGSYSVGPDNRGCLTIVNSNGGTGTFRIALGTMSAGVATQGAITSFADTTGQNPRLTGILKQQNLTSATLSGTYAFGWDGIDSGGYRVAAAGLITADGAGNVTNTTFDVNDNGAALTLSGSGSYSLTAGAPGGRGTVQTTTPVPGGAVTADDALYVISPSDAFIISTDPTDGSHPILSGELKLQTGPFSTSVLASGSGYVFYVSGIDSSNGGNDIVLGQAAFTTNTGIATLTIDENDYGIDAPESSLQETFQVDSSGRTTLTGVGPSPPIIYLVDATQGFVVNTGSQVQSGYIQKQTQTSFSTSTISGQYFFEGGAPTTGSSFDSGIINFSPGGASGTITGTTDGSQPNCGDNPNDNCGGNGLVPNNPISGGSGSALPYTFSTGPAAPGQGCIGGVVAPQACLGGLIGYIVSPSQVIFLQTGTSGNTNPAELFIGQQ